jgi:putative spermidine/putrescine transport system permease protein
MLLSPGRMGPGRFGLYAVTAVIVLFLLTPIVFVFVLSFNSSRWMIFPPPGWTLKWYEQFFASPAWRQALVTSLQTAVIVAALALALGLPASFALVRGRFRGKELLNAFFTAPLIVPLIITGIAIYGLVLRAGLSGTVTALVLAHLVIALPFTITMISNSLRSFDVSLEKAAQVCGASPLRALFSVTLPAIKQGILAGTLFAFLISWDEVVLAVFMAGTETQTVPVKMWTMVRSDITPEVAAAAGVMIATTMLIMALILVASRSPVSKGKT